MGTCTITNERLEELERLEAKLNALEIGGVANWSGYPRCIKNHYEENILKKKKKKLVDDLEKLFKTYVTGISFDFFNNDMRKETHKLLYDHGVVFEKEKING